MKLSEAVEIIENNPQLKKQFIKNCIKEMGEKIIIKKLIWKNNYMDTYEEAGAENIPIGKPREISRVIEEIIFFADIKEYNESIIARDLMEGKYIKEIVKDRKAPKELVREIKQKIYEELKK